MGKARSGSQTQSRPSDLYPSKHGGRSRSALEKDLHGQTSGETFSVFIEERWGKEYGKKEAERKISPGGRKAK